MTRSRRAAALGGLFLVLLAAPSAGMAQTAMPAGMKYCRADIQRLCAGIEPGGGRIVACLKQHMNEVSIGCGKALQKIKGEMSKAQ